MMGFSYLNRLARYTGGTGYWGGFLPVGSLPGSRLKSGINTCHFPRSLWVPLFSFIGVILGYLPLIVSQLPSSDSRMVNARNMDPADPFGQLVIIPSGIMVAANRYAVIGGAFILIAGRW